MLPLPAAEQANRGVLERTLHGAAETASGLKQQLVDAGVQLKQHAGYAYYRAADPTPLSGVRPGAAATLITGCLALGGGATYCAEQGVDPLGKFGSMVGPAPEKKEEKAPAERPAAQPPAQTPTSPPTPPQARSSPPQPKAPAPTQSAPTQPTPPQPAQPPSQAAPSAPGPQNDFDFEQSRPAVPRTPAPAPRQGGGEFF